MFFFPVEEMIYDVRVWLYGSTPFIFLTSSSGVAFMIDNKPLLWMVIQACTFWRYLGHENFDYFNSLYFQIQTNIFYW